MSLNSKSFLPSLAILFGIIATSGCGGTSGQPSATNKPASVVEKNVEPVKAPEVAPLPVVAEVKPGAVVPIDLGAGRPVASAKPSAEGVTLLPANWSEYVKHVVPEGGKKFTLVDAWATWCAPCKENFPHVVEMHEKYASKGLQVISLSMDDLSDSKAVKEATEFLVSKKAVFKNLIMNEAQDVAFDKLAISAIPSVFIFDSSGKEIRRFTLEDPNNQFTYAQVEATIEALLAGKPLPEFKKDSTPAEKTK
jgi:thiol-disulfide isomerase/thioredoxin